MRRALWTLVLMLAGCGDSTGPAQNVTGTWAGSMNGVETTITVTQTGSVIAGTGLIDGPGGSQAMTVAGTYKHPKMTVFLTAPGFPQVTFTGVLRGDTVTGVLNGPGISNVSYSLTRQ